MISHIHHINFIVKNLDSAVAQYRKRLNLGEFIIDTLALRGVKTARIKLGDTWLVLVQPTNETGFPASFLNEHGEGFFLLSLGTDDLDAQLKNFEKTYTKSPHVERRRGLENWLIADLPREDFFGVQLQLTED